MSCRLHTTIDTATITWYLSYPPLTSSIRSIVVSSNRYPYVFVVRLNSSVLTDLYLCGTDFKFDFYKFFVQYITASYSICISGFNVTTTFFLYIIVLPYVPIFIIHNMLIDHLYTYKLKKKLHLQYVRTKFW